MAAWEAKAEYYFANGNWPSDMHSEGTKPGDGAAQ